jgi:hypothetical protein
MKAGYDKKRTDEMIAQLKQQNELLRAQNLDCQTELNDFKMLMAPTGTVEGSLKGTEKLKKMATSLKHQNEILSEENKELGKILNAFRDGNYNAVAGAKMLADE